jgi:hypothetical protein
LKEVDLALQGVEAKFPSMVVPIYEACDIMWADAGCSGSFTVVNVARQDNLSRDHIHVSNQGPGWFVWIERESGLVKAPLLVREEEGISRSFPQPVVTW